MKKYRFSFVGAHALVSEFVKLAEFVCDGIDVEEVDTGFLGNEKKETYIRKFRELKHRIKNLTDYQIQLLAKGTYDQQLQLTHLALCKAYRIYKDFVTEVLVEKVQLYDYSITDLDYNSFISRKKVDHSELDELAPSTQKKVKQVIFKMLEQVRLIDSAKNPTLQIPILDSEVEKAIVKDDVNLLKCFLQDHNQTQSQT